MYKYNFLLSFLLLSEVFDFHDSVTTMADNEHSGDGISSTVPSTEGSTSSGLFSISGNKSEEQNATTTETENTVTESTSPEEMNENESILTTAVIIGVAVVLLIVLLIILVIFIVRRRKRKQSQEDELGNENGKEKSPIFEEDTPSVMEIEMEELDKWMNSLKKNAESDYLPALKEEKDCNTNPSDCES